MMQQQPVASQPMQQLTYRLGSGGDYGYCAVDYAVVPQLGDRSSLDATTLVLP